ncbi:MAG: choice-of-anchor D domain-containing protein [Anaerolineae bacterium]|nr:choice-of-anchor D domain-containing protein [Anaerolineae bacterium]
MAGNRFSIRLFVLRAGMVLALLAGLQTSAQVVSAGAPSTARDGSRSYAGEAAPAYATTLTVNTTADSTAADGFCSLREAVAYTNGALFNADCGGNSGSPYTIHIPAGTYTLTLGELQAGLNGNVTVSIIGAGAANTILQQGSSGCSGTRSSRVLSLDYNYGGNTQASISGVTLSNGAAQLYGGGAILAGGPNDSLTLSNAIISNNCTASNNEGAGISWGSEGSLTIDNSTFSNNTTSNRPGGGIYFFADTPSNNLTITNSIFTSNTVTSSENGGGAVAIVSSGGSFANVSINSSVFTNNKTMGSSGLGGAIFMNDGTLNLGNTAANRFYNNLDNSAGGALGKTGGTANAANNWWGCNTGPGGTGCDSVNNRGGSLTISPWVVLKTTASPSAIQSGQSTTLTTSVLQNSNGGSLAAGQISALIGLPVTWTNATGGSFSGSQTSIQIDGTATTTFTQDGLGCSPASGQAKIDLVQNGDATATASIAVSCLPEMGLSQGATTLADGASFDFGSQALNTNTDLVFSIGNSGLGNLTLTTPLTVSGANADQFSILAQPASPVAASGSTTFSLRFRPTAAGVKTATLSIANNDNDENPYDLTLTGEGLPAPEMAVRGNGVDIADGDTTPSVTDHTNFGSMPVNGGSVVRTFTIHNSGLADLSLNGAPQVAVSGTNAADFSVTAFPASPVSAAGSTTFQVTFIPGALGTRSATLSIDNNDSEENPYTFAIQGTGTCASAITVTNANTSGPGSLTQAVENLCAGGTITFDGDYTIPIHGLIPAKSLTMDGSGHSVTINGGLLINAGETIVLNDLALLGQGAGGGSTLAIINRGTLTFNRCTVSNYWWSIDPANLIAPGAIYNTGALTINQSTLSDNNTSEWGGAIYNSGTVSITQSTLVRNQANYGGGAIYNAPSGALAIARSTLGQNHAAGIDGGAIYNDGTLSLVNSTVAENSAPNAGGLYLNGSTALLNTLIAKNIPGQIFVAGSVSHTAGNLIDTGAGNSLLANLGDYGGLTQTYALLPGSAAINAGALTFCDVIDQRGVVYVDVCDIGAFESQGFSLTVESGNNQGTVINTAFTSPLVVAVTANHLGDPVDGGKVTFTAPASGASASLSTSPVTISGGKASITATANGTTGVYQVTASANGAANVNFSLTNAIPSSAVTNAATLVTKTSATLNGTVNPNGLNTSVSFQYGLDTSYGTTVTASESPLSGSGSVAVHVDLSGLSPDTTYHFRVVGVNAGGTTNGGDLTFTTLKPLTVAINQAGSQADPTHASPILFSAVFNQPIDPAGFTSDDVSLSSSAPGTLAVAVNQVAPMDGTTFEISVSGMTGDGTISVSMAENKVATPLGVGNDVSTFTDKSVTYLHTIVTTTTLTVTEQPYRFGQAWNLSATVTSASGTPVGSVTFKDGATVLGTVSLSGGVAVLDLASLPVGEHAITAEYQGSGSYASSISDAVAARAKMFLILPLIFR